jgi:hypothetical protein
LRILDQQQLAFVPTLPRAEADALLEYWYERMRNESGFTGRLAGDHHDLLLWVDKARNDYKNARRSIARHLHARKVGWADDTPGAEALRALLAQDEVAGLRILEAIHGEVLDLLLWHSRDPGSVTSAEVEERARERWLEHGHAMRHALDEDDDTAGQDDPAHGGLTIGRLLDHFSGDEDEGLDGEPQSGFCRLLDGSVSHESRRSLQAGFNRQGAAPFVVVAQSSVGREGLNLHRACRRVFLFHPEWNPGVMEQQIGRVDRINSRWTELANEWKKAGPGKELPDYPRIEVESLVFRGTYDEYQFEILSRRRASLDAQLFGTLLDEESLERVPEEQRALLRKKAPSWEP